MKSVLLAQLGGMLVAQCTHAAYLGITWEKDVFALNGTTPLSNLPGYQGQAVYNVYAVFDDLTDQAIGVVGTPVHPFSVFVQGAVAQGFYNSPNDTPFPDNAPTQPEASFFPSLNWDSFYTIGKKLEPYSQPMIVAPGTCGPPDNGKWDCGANSTNMAWVFNPNLPKPETLAGACGRVLLMRLSVDNQSDVIEGSFGVLVFVNGVGSEVGGSFMTVAGAAPSSSGLTCQGDTDCDGMVDVSDLVSVIIAWGCAPPAACAADVTGDGVVDVTDLVAVIAAWGPCGSASP